MKILHIPSVAVLAKYKTALALVTSLTLSAIIPVTAQAAPVDEQLVNQIKRQLLEDKDFIAQIGQKTQAKDEEKIQQVVKDYLLKNPEILVKMQDELTARQEAEIVKNQSKIIETMKDKIFSSPNDFILGNKNGKVTIVEFFDYNCGYCKHSFPDMQALIKNNPDVKFILKDFPILGQESFKAHIVAHAFQKISPDKYAAFHTAMMTREGRSTEQTAIDVAKSLGADEKKLRETMKNPDIQKPFMENGQIAYELNINGTPSYIIGDQVFVGAVGGDILQKKIDTIEKAQ